MPIVPRHNGYRDSPADFNHHRLAADIYLYPTQIRQEDLAKEQGTP